MMLRSTQHTKGAASTMRPRRIRPAVLVLAALSGSACMAQATTPVDVAGRAFANHCFSPYLTAQKASEAAAPTGARLDFYDLRPFSSAAPSPATGAPVTPGTDRRCEMAFDGAVPAQAADWVGIGLKQEGLTGRTIDVPSDFTRARGTSIIAAVQLNPNRIAVVQTGVRPGPNGPETFMNVERLTPLDENQ